MIGGTRPQDLTVSGAECRRGGVVQAGQKNASAMKSLTLRAVCTMVSVAARIELVASEGDRTVGTAVADNRSIRPLVGGDAREQFAAMQMELGILRDVSSLVA